MEYELRIIPFFEGAADENVNLILFDSLISLLAVRIG
jgi:hypothetical protein